MRKSLFAIFMMLAIINTFSISQNNANRTIVCGDSISTERVCALDNDSIQFRTNLIAHILLLEDSVQSVKRKQTSILLKQISDNKKLLMQCVDFFESSYYDRNYHQQAETFLKIGLEYVTQSSLFSDIEKVRYKFMFDLISKNAVGEKATDFLYTLRNNKTYNLHSIKARYLIVFFNSPDCEDCLQTKSTVEMYFRKNKKHLQQAEIKLLAIYPNNEIELWSNISYYKDWINAYDSTMNLLKKRLYDLPSLPVLYFLDKEKKVIMKNVDWVKIEDYLHSTISNQEMRSAEHVLKNRAAKGEFNSFVHVLNDRDLVSSRNEKRRIGCSRAQR